MNIGIDITPVIYGTGVSQYTQNLTLALMSQLSTEDTLTLFGASLRQHQELARFSQRISKASTKIIPCPPGITSFLFNTLRIPIETITGPLNIYHAWDWYIPPSRGAARVVTVHDVALFKYPDTAHRQIRAHHELVLNTIRRESVNVIAVSNTTKNDLVSMFNISSQKITVIPEALPAHQQIKVNENKVKKVHKKYSLKKPYLLTVGTLEPRKNLARVIAAWQHSYKKDYDLVCVGRAAWDKLPKFPGLHYLGHISNQELAALYRGASCFVYASLYEGFGLPILEAFHHQVPVVTSNNSGMVEVASTAAVLVDPQSSESIVYGIEKALSHSKSYQAKGNARLKQFSWQKAAAATYHLYNEIAG